VGGWARDRQNDGIQDCSTYVRQLFAAHEEAGALCRIPPLSDSEREKVRFAFLYVLVVISFYVTEHTLSFVKAV
jgi:hypothetical protein